MTELRWNPVLEEWVGTASERQERTFFPPRDYCPLCPTRPGGFPTEIPAPDYEIVTFQNRFPAFTPDPPEPAVAGDELMPVAPAQGICEVLVYSPVHDATLTDLPVSHFRNLVEVWTDRFAELGAHEYVKYVYIFENKGEVIGVTLSHPHGQIYAFPFVPPVPGRELASARRHFERTGRCLFCDILDKERRVRTRIVVENEHFTSFVPFYARWPYETHVYPRAHRSALTDLTAEERDALADVLKRQLVQFDALWQRSLPYIMLMHQRPTDTADYPHYHFHIEFLPPYRTREKLKFLAGVEQGAGTFLNDTVAEDKAAELRKA
jgi:UDPglucose--hexose-1-phosphate uridylyltransferase